MKRKVVFNGNNATKVFGGILKDLEIIAGERKVETTELIRSFIKDVKNSENEEYEREIQEINIEDVIPPRVKSELVSYLNRALKNYNRIQQNKNKKSTQKSEKEEKEKIWKPIEEKLLQIDQRNLKLEYINNLKKDITEGKVYEELKKSQVSYIIKKLDTLIEENEKINEKEKEEKERKLNKKWKEISDIVNKTSIDKNKSKFAVWHAIYEGINQESKDNKINLNVPEDIEETLKSKINEEIKTEGAEYYNNVKKYTENFEFLTGFRGVSFARHGHREFLNREHSRMFESLVSKLRNNENIEHPEKEEQFLKRILSKGVANSYYDKKIIEGRINRIKQDKELAIKKRRENMLR